MNRLYGLTGSIVLSFLAIGHAEGVPSTPPPTVTPAGTNVINDVSNTFNEVEKAIAVMFAKLNQEAKDDAAQIQAQIAALQQQRAKLRELRNKLKDLDVRQLTTKERQTIAELLKSFDELESKIEKVTAATPTPIPPPKTKTPTPRPGTSLNPATT